MSISVPPALEDVKSAHITVLAERLSANNSITTVLGGDFIEPKIDLFDQNRLEFDQKGGWHQWISELEWANLYKEGLIIKLAKVRG